MLTRSAASSLAHNNLEIADSAYLIVRGLTLTGGSIGLRIHRGHHVTVEDTEISHTQNNAIAVNIA